ncbi:MAG: hypothetical protein B7733_00820 [Myxococcales bacterium FL481]|nr:MAG: hypothetical protein B7733_00820 [Myxococcales bacterium FL481]
MNTFLRELEIQRWDDHRYYHRSRINQSLHLVSAMAFLVSYVLLFSSPAIAATIGWLVAMVTRQSGHFFFEPKGYDDVNQATHAHKEAIKVGYNLRRKIVLIAVWLASPALLLVSPSLFGWLEPATSAMGVLNNVGVIWLAVGGGALLFRVVQLCFVRDVQTAIVWATKILTDPFHDIKMYYRSPLFVMRGELYDPIETHQPAAAVTR